MMKLKDILEFLKPNKWNFGLTVLIILAVILCWIMILPGYDLLLKILPEGIREYKGMGLYGVLLTFLIGTSIISYTLISLIVYFVGGDYKK